MKHANTVFDLNGFFTHLGKAIEMEIKWLKNMI